MGTDNPKVSAYVPQSLKERLKEFRKERDDISESQAVILILAEYFQMPEVLGRSLQGGNVGGVTLARMEALEEKLTSFTTLVEHRLQQLEQEIRNISGISVVHPVLVDVTTSTSEQISSSPSELQVTAGVIEQVEELSVVDQYLDQKFASDGKESSLSSELLAEALIQDAVQQDVQLGESASTLPSELQAIEAEAEKADELPTSNQEAGQLVFVTKEQADILPSRLPVEELNQKLNEGGTLEAPQEVSNSILSSGLLNEARQEAEEWTKPNTLLSELKEADLVTAPQEVEEAVSQIDLALERDSQSTDEVIGNGQLELIEPALPNLLSEPLEELGLIPGIRLSKLRFGLSESRISAMKKEMSLEEFTQWTKDKDPNGIPWKYVKSPAKGYVPAEELSSEQKSSLLKWIKENLQ